MSNPPGEYLQEAPAYKAPNGARPVLRLRGVVKVYHSVAGDFTALKGIDLDVYAGEFLAITGKSGAGKSTLINMITGVDQMTAGEAWAGETPIHKLNENQLARWRGRSLGIIYQSFHLMPTLSLLDNVLLPMDLCGLYRGRASAERAMDLLREVGLEEHALKLPSAISGGQQQRVAIARALANDAPLILADEPTGRLDSVTAGSILEIFSRLVREGRTILMVTHDETLAERVSSQIQIVDGELYGDKRRQAGTETYAS